MTSLSLMIGHASHTGMVREINEDSYLVLTKPATEQNVDALLLVADGVGGANAGEVASGLLVESFWHWFTCGDYADSVHYSSHRPDYFIAVLKDLIESVNNRLYQLSFSDPELAKMGTTGTVGLIKNNRLFVGHVGDTRAYLLRGGHLSRITEDHSWVAEEVAAGRLTPAQAQHHPKRNLVSRVLGNSSLLRVDREEYELLPGDQILIATDGLTGAVNDNEIHHYMTTQPTPQAACNALVALANARGGDDNITVLIAQTQSGKALSNVPSGVAVSSVHLGMGAATPAGTGKGATSVTQVLTKPVDTNVSPRSKQHRQQHSLWPIALTMLVSIGLGIATLFVPQLISQLPTLGDFVINANLVTALLVSLAVWIGFVIHFLSTRRIERSKHPSINAARQPA